MSTPDYVRDTQASIEFLSKANNEHGGDPMDVARMVLYRAAEHLRKELRAYLTGPREVRLS